MRVPRSIARCTCLYLVFALFFLTTEVAAQSSTNSSTPLPGFTLSAGNTTITSFTVSSSSTVSFTSVVPTTYNLSLSASSTSSSAAAATSTAPPSYSLSTKIDPGFGVLGALLILTGLSSAFWGHKNRWTSFFLIGFYTLAIVCFVLILQYGIIPAIHPPSTSLRGLFLLACIVAGAVGGAISIFFWKFSRYFIGAWGGLAFGLFIQCFRNGGLIGPIGYRWIMYIGCSVIGFCLCTIPRIHYHVLLVSTAFVGATALILGVDCYTTAGLKEFYVWNIGYRALFPTFTQHGIQFPVSQTMQIELGLIGAISVMGVAVQLRVLKLLLRKLHEIEREQKKRELDEEAVVPDFENIQQERKEWESRHNREQSAFSSLDLSKGQHPGTPLPEYFATEQPEAPDAAANPRSQSPGALPALDFGNDIQNDVPRDYLTENSTSNKDVSVPIVTSEGLKSRESLLTEIQNIRRSIDVLKAEPSSSSPTPYSRSNRLSVTSRRTLSQDLNSIAQYRANSQPGSQSRETSTMLKDTLGSSMPRPRNSTLQDDWDSYVRDRSLFQPPSGITAPIPTMPFPAMRRASMSAAVLDAVAQRQQRESLMAFGEFSRLDSDLDLPTAMSPQRDLIQLERVHARAKSAGTIPVTILPPKRSLSPELRKSTEPRVATYEELAERHRHKMKELQAPVTDEVNKQAEIAAAKERWERSIAREKEVVTKRQAEKAAVAFGKDHQRRKSADLDTTTRERPRTLSADKLAGVGSRSSRRMSMMKVEDWQKHQQGIGEEPSALRGQPRSAKRSGPSAVPFPDSRPRNSRHLSSLSRDLPQ